MKQMVQKLQKTLGVKFVSTVKVVSESDLEAAVNDGNYSVAFYPFKAKSSFAGEIIEGFDQTIYSDMSPMFYHRKSVISKIIRAALRVSVPPLPMRRTILFPRR